MHLQKILTRKFVPLVNDIIFSAQNEREFFTSLTSFPEYIQNMEVLDDAFYFDTDWMDNIQTKYKAESIEKFDSYIQAAYTHAEALISFAHTLDQNSDTLEKKCTDSISLLRNLLAFLPITHPLAKTIENRVITILKEKGVTESAMQTVLLDITTPEKINAPLAEQIALHTLAKRMSDPQFDLEIALDEHTAQFAFLGYREPFAVGYTKEFFRARLSDVLTNPPNTHVSEHHFSLTAEEQALVDLMKEFVYFRNYRTEKLYEALYYIEPIWSLVAHEYTLSDKHDLSYYLMSEVNDLFRENKKVPDTVIANRKEHFGILLHNNSWKYLDGNVVVALKQERNAHVTAATALKGTPACKGIVSGTARIVLSASEQDKIQPGDILITNMTTPDFLPSMKRAAAFVTDEGGITCHAAIVAREMKKPCVIGTKTATVSFKDGDRITVDANTGTVCLT